MDDVTGDEAGAGLGGTGSGRTPDLVGDRNRRGEGTPVLAPDVAVLAAPDEPDEPPKTAAALLTETTGSELTFSLGASFFGDTGSGKGRLNAFTGEAALAFSG
jgi:hypothetical protein